MQIAVDIEPGITFLLEHPHVLEHFILVLGLVNMLKTAELLGLNL
jgi:hypothetical protein